MRSPLQGPATAVATLLVLAIGAALTGCGRPGPAPGPIASAAPLVGAMRRLAHAAASPTDELRLNVPERSTRAVIHVAAIRDGWGLGRSATARMRLRSPGGEPLELASVSIPVRSAESGSWQRIDVTLPATGVGEARELTLSLDEAGAAERAWWSVTFEGRAPPGSRNILLISLDTVRVDAVSAFGQVLPTTPRLDELAARGTIFTQAISAAPWTLPSHVSVMTGVLPSWHGRVDPLRLDRELAPLPTLATILGDRGYETAAITGSGSISWALGTTRGFSSIIETDPTRDPKWWRVGEPECNVGARAAIAFLEGRKTAAEQTPFFLFWHTYEPHFPYHDERFLGTRAPLPPGVAEDAREDWQRYLGDLARADAALGAILEALDSEGLAASTDIIVMSDHGEDFGEHSDGRRDESTRHGSGVFETQLRVPLVVVSPSIEGGRRDEQVSLLDVFPTILSCAGVDAPASPGALGLALQAPGGSPEVLSEALFPRYVEQESKSVRAATGLKYVASLSAPAQESLFDVRVDPLEASDLAASRPEESAADLARLRGSLLLALEGAPAALPPVTDKGTGADLPPSVLESLRSLGYVE